MTCADILEPQRLNSLIHAIRGHVCFLFLRVSSRAFVASFLFPRQTTPAACLAFGKVDLSDDQSSTRNSCPEAPFPRRGGVRGRWLWLRHLAWHVRSTPRSGNGSDPPCRDSAARERVEPHRLYRLLVKVDGIGPRLALAALGALPMDELVQAIRSREVKVLTRIPGIGKKTAEKLCFELSEKLGGQSGLEGLGALAAQADGWESDLRSALTNLGFKEDVVLPVLAGLRAQKPPLPEAIRLALRMLQK
jgi:hypothetical protein